LRFQGKGDSAKHFIGSDEGSGSVVNLPDGILYVFGEGVVRRGFAREKRLEHGNQEVTRWIVVM
jgi:hypothetical protein